MATSAKRPPEFIEKEEAEVHRRSSVDERAMSLAQTHRRFSLMSEQGRARGESEKRDTEHLEKQTTQDPRGQGVVPLT